MSAHPLESLSAFLDDELGTEERRDVETHLAACPSCARHLGELAAVDALARDLPPAGAPDGYLEALPGRVRRRIRADRPASAPPWVWPLAAGLALAVLAPIVLLQQRARYSPAADRAANETVPPATPAMTVAPAPPAPATADELRDTRPQAAARTLRRESAPAPEKSRDAFAAPPAAAPANESDQAAAREGGEAVGGITGGAPAAAPPAEEEAYVAAGRAKQEQVETADARGARADAPPPLKKANAPRQAAAESKRIEDPEKAFLENASLPASTPEEARRAREAWRRFVALHPAGPRADEGRVRFIEAAVAAFHLTGDPADRAIAEREGRAYLAAAGAPQASRVRGTLRVLERDR
jgi:hypothetical protein